MAESVTGRPLVRAGGRYRLLLLAGVLFLLGARRRRDSRGAVTAEHAVMTLGGVCFAGVLVSLLGGIPIIPMPVHPGHWLYDVVLRVVEWLFQLIKSLFPGLF